ncbi:MAG: aspartate/glutamate racemase family protein, partial [Chloroflexota bacterium]
MTKHIGIVACSAEGAALCYRTICTEGMAATGKGTHPEVTMHTPPFDKYVERLEAGDWQGVAALMLDSVMKVAHVGADFAICPDNTIHQAFDMVALRSPIPWLHIAEMVAAEARERGYRRLGILGTRLLMEGPVYSDKLAKLGMEYRIPNPEARERINRIIFEELVRGRFSAESLAYFASVIAEMRQDGCDAVVLGCTEIPLLVSQEDSRLPILDSTRLLARAALKKAVEINGG